MFLSLQQADVLSSAGLRTALMCAGVMSTLKLKQLRQQQQQSQGQVCADPLSSRHSRRSSSESEGVSDGLDDCVEVGSAHSWKQAAQTSEQRGPCAEDGPAIAQDIGLWGLGPAQIQSMQPSPVVMDAPSQPQQPQQQQKETQAQPTGGGEGCVAGCRDDGHSRFALPISGRMEATSRRWGCEGMLCMEAWGCACGGPPGLCLAFGHPTHMIDILSFASSSPRGCIGGPAAFVAASQA